MTSCVGIRIMCQSGVTCLSVDWDFSELALLISTSAYWTSTKQTSTSQLDLTMIQLKNCSLGIKQQFLPQQASCQYTSYTYYPVVCSRAHVLFTLYVLVCVQRCPTQCVVFFVLSVFILCLVYSMLPVFLDCLFLISPSVFSNVYPYSLIIQRPIFHIDLYSTQTYIPPRLIIHRPIIHRLIIHRLIFHILIFHLDL